MRIQITAECVLRATGERLMPPREVDLDAEVASRLVAAGCARILPEAPPPGGGSGTGEDVDSTPSPAAGRRTRRGGRG